MIAFSFESALLYVKIQRPIRFATVAAQKESFSKN
jgi:hypothetical protein